MKIRHLSKHDMMILLEMIHDSLASRSEAEIRNVMSRLNALIPYQAALSFISKIGANGMAGSMTVVNVDYPVEYLVELEKSGLAVKDPIVIENFKSFKLQFWADTFKRQHAFTEDTRKIFALAEDFGFHKVRSGYGYAHGVSNLKRTEGSFFCYQGLERSSRTEEILELVIPHFHEALRRVSTILRNGQPLTSKETEILKWIKQGKTTWDISTILGISERTVKFHVANILQKLDAATRAHAVAIALERKLIDIE